MRKKRFKKGLYLLTAMGCICAALWGKPPEGHRFFQSPAKESRPLLEPSKEALSLDNLPAYSKAPYIEVNGGRPYFEEREKTSSSFARYSPLDDLGRCGAAFANIGQDLMPTQERGQIGQVKPTGWQFSKYDFVDGRYLYNRCHLIGYQLAGENANVCNLITGTRYMNIKGMLPFENQVADYVKKTGNHVLYRVTPIFEGEELLCRGVLMEAFSTEDEGKGICFCVFVYNVQPGVVIDYATGKNRADDAGAESVYSLE